jgi:2'-5' RNA ligase
MRAFVAVKVADAVRGRLAEVREELRRADADVKWVDEASLHLTLKFLGWVEDEAVAKLTDLLAAEAPRWPALRLDYAGVGAFPERGAPRVVWAGCSGDVETLGALAAAVERAAEAVGVPREGRPFKPHLTIGRVKSPRNVKRLQAALPKFRDTPFGSDTVTEVVLFESTLRPQGPIYTPRAVFPLAATGHAP